jgi:hypothetical protein
MTLQKDLVSVLITQDSWQVRSFSDVKLLEHRGDEVAERTHFLPCNYRFQRAKVRAVRTSRCIIMVKVFINQRSIWFANAVLNSPVLSTVATRGIGEFQISAGQEP